MKEDIRANNIWKHGPHQVPLINTLLVNKVKSSNTEDGRNVFPLFYVFGFFPAFHTNMSILEKENYAV